MKLLLGAGVAAVVGTAQAVNVRPSMGVLSTSGTACLLDESKAGSDPIPPQCGCSFSRLADMKEKCAALSSTSTSREAEECSSIPCEICCVMRSASVPVAGEDRTHLDCKKKCPKSEEILSAVRVRVQAMDLTDVFYPPNEEPLSPVPGLPTTQQFDVPSPPPFTAAGPSSETTYPLLTLPSEEDFAAAEPTSPQQLDSISRANNAVIQQTAEA
ncbi:hypothetical protein BESB_072480 [Besnoitia besnoiti]|uniref:Uncharacterized protein n=1 Tax=Besnoitia besnoiti TaxID=94643 RepID=A0A2A9MDR8_BESBE|nr:uncharacterized protein BESB_072480 [Besnoitia besnoiti]PFH34096.1 hypothetical protein BESB_072480 [Besnoitia besnoiti]